MINEKLLRSSKHSRLFLLARCRCLLALQCNAFVRFVRSRKQRNAQISR